MPSPSLTAQFIAVGIAVGVLESAPVCAAENSPIANSSAKTKAEEALVLAPFQVVTANDDGWVAGNTMLGNRTNQPGFLNAKPLA